MVEQALSDLKVLDLTHLIAGPYCTKLFADFGADVIKVEKSGGGDDARRLGPFPHDIPDQEASGLFLYLNHNKRGITLNLEGEQGREIFLDLVRWADVLVESFQPGTMAKLGLDYETLSSISQKLVMTSISNFGQHGPYRYFKAADIIHYGLTGLSFVTGTPDREPLKGPADQAQYQAGLFAYNGTMTALLARDQIGWGQHVDVSLWEAMCALFQPYIFRWASTPGPFPRSGERAGRAGGPSGGYPCKDGYVFFFVRSDLQWKFFLKILELDLKYAEDPRFETTFDRRTHVDEIDQLIEPALMKKDRETLFREFNAHGILVGMVLSTEDLFKSEHLAERRFFTEVDHPHAGAFFYPGAPFIMSETPWGIRRPAPMLGQHNREVFIDLLGLKESDLVKLRQLGVI
ncbi:MAG: CoA transferase [Candidatus Tectomicrobia bacterium]|nr:CoA transferase [Candidatus Tectomicrobia bacterium]